MIEFLLLAGSLAAAATPCEGLKALALPDTTITRAEGRSGRSGWWGR